MSGRKLSTVAIDIRVAGRWLEFYKQPIEELKTSLVILKTSVVQGPGQIFDRPRPGSSHLACITYLLRAELL